MNEVIMERISSDGRVETMCRTVAVFVMVFVIFYMSYSNKFFMRRRMKELGIYALLGYRKTDMLRLLALENIWICLGGLMAGVLAGSLLHKGLTGGIIAFLGLTIDNSIIPFMNVKAVTRSAIFVLLVLLVLTCSNAKVLWKATLLDMVRLEKKAEKPVSILKMAAALMKKPAAKTDFMRFCLCRITDFSSHTRPLCSTAFLIPTDNHASLTHLKYFCLPPCPR